MFSEVLPMLPNPYLAFEPGFSKLYIFGAGGFAREVAWLVSQAWGDRVEPEFLVDDPAYLADNVNGVRCSLLMEAETGPEVRYVVGVGDPRLRRVMVEASIRAGLQEATVVHPRVESSRWNRIGAGSIVCAGSILTVNIELGKHVHVNLDCTIGHDVRIGDFSTLSPGVHISGNVTIGTGVFIGTGATIINGSHGRPLSIGDGAVIAAGACVTRSVETAALVAGVPAIRKR